MRNSVNISSDTFVIVRIWLAKINEVEASILEVLGALRDDPNANACVGHASLQIVKNGGDDTRYASYWPSREVGPEEVVAGKFYSVQGDLKAKGEPDKIFVLFSLDNVALWNAMEPNQLQHNFPHYTLIDGYMLRQKVRQKVSFWGVGSEKKETSNSNMSLGNKKPVSCSGLVYNLVTRYGYNGAGFQYLQLSYDFTRDFVVTSPNNLANLFLEAEKKERALWPNTAKHRANIVSALSRTLLSKKQLSDFETVYHAVGDLLRKSSTNLQQIFQHQQSLNSPLSVPTSTSTHVPRNDVLPTPQIRMPATGFGPLFPLLVQAQTHPKTCTAILLLFSYLLGSYSEEISGVLKPLAYLTVIAVSGVFLFNSLSKNNQNNNVNVNMGRDRERGNHEETQNRMQHTF